MEVKAGVRKFSLGSEFWVKPRTIELKQRGFDDVLENDL